MNELEKTLAAVASGELSPESAVGRLKRGEVRYLDEFAALDLGRLIRKGVPEVVYARSKSPTQVASICETLLESRERVIVSAPTPEHEARIRATLPEIQFRRAGRSLVMGYHDVGVAGVHRLAGPLEELRGFDPDCLVVAAGMEGALPSVVSGLVAVPVIGLPTSTGYGLGGDGTAAILGMLQTCSPGLCVVNVDNGVG